jgi:fused signal recognition particle receptor
LELALLENNVAVEVIEKIKHDLKEALTSGRVSRTGIEGLIQESLHESVSELFEEPFDLVETVQSKKPYVIVFVGVNGAGKTTTLAKIANMFQENDLSVVMAAADTFRAAAIDQLQSHANNLGIKLISQGYGADPAAVAYDAIEHAKAKNVDVVMIDTAGRLHSNTNLMAELEKVIRVAKPDMKIFIGESITGNDCVEQAQQFDEKVGIDAIILSKADVDEKGGAAISVSHVTKKPILYLGTGQSYGDLEPFDKERILRALDLQ